jgi:hypothetical protein
VRRFEDAGLEMPAVEIHFREGLSGCGGHFGHAKCGRVDLCTSLVDAPARRALLHEMGTSGSTRISRRPLRGILGAPRTPRVERVLGSWEQRGYEQGAEIMAWALGERILKPSIPDNDPEWIVGAFERRLTGIPIPQRAHL